MDPIHYDRIADLLCQVRAKVENNLRPRTKEGKVIKELYLAQICDMLLLNDQIANKDYKELIWDEITQNIQSRSWRYTIDAIIAQ